MFRKRDEIDSTSRYHPPPRGGCRLGFGGHCTPVWSPHTVCNINKLERCRRWFTKRVQGLYNTNYFDRWTQLGLESLQSRRLMYNLVTCYKIIHHDITIHSPTIYIFNEYGITRGHRHKLFKCQSAVNANKYFCQSCLRYLEFITIYCC